MGNRPWVRSWSTFRDTLGSEASWILSSCHWLRVLGNDLRDCLVEPFRRTQCRRCSLLRLKRVINFHKKIFSKHFAKSRSVNFQTSFELQSFLSSLTWVHGFVHAKDGAISKERRINCKLLRVITFSSIFILLLCLLLWPVWLKVLSHVIGFTGSSMLPSVFTGKKHCSF